MTSRMKQIAALLIAIEEMKSTMVIVEADPNLSFVEKGQKLAHMRETLRRVGWHTLDLMQQERDGADGEDGNGSEEHA